MHMSRAVGDDGSRFDHAAYSARTRQRHAANSGAGGISPSMATPRGCLKQNWRPRQVSFRPALIFLARGGLAVSSGSKSDIVPSDGGRIAGGSTAHGPSTTDCDAMTVKCGAARQHVLRDENARQSPFRLSSQEVVTVDRPPKSGAPGGSRRDERVHANGAILSVLNSFGGIRYFAAASPECARLTCAAGPDENIQVHLWFHRARYAS